MILHYKAVIEVGLGVSARPVEAVEVVTYQGIVGVAAGHYHLEVIRVHYLTRITGGY